MSKIIAISGNFGDFSELKRKISRLCECEIYAIVYRDKALNSDIYERNLVEILKISQNHKTKIFAHNFYEVAKKLNHPYIWLPLPVLRNLKGENLSKFEKITASVHSELEAKEALNLGATTLCLSHIFPTICKADLEPKGINLIKNVREFFNGEIYALGGINSQNFQEVLNAKADKIAILNAIMQTKNEKEFLANFNL